MATNRPTDLSDAMLREILLLLEQGISPGRLRPEAINVARSMLGSSPDAEGVFGNIPSELRRRKETNQPSYAQEVINEAEEWLAQASLSSHPVGLTLGCFPAGIESGCRKHLECPTEVEKNCPFRDESSPASIELKERWNDKNKDIMPVLRRCQFLGCVRPERAKVWLEQQREKTGVPIHEDGQPSAAQRVTELKKLLGSSGKEPGCSGSEAASHRCLDSLCPHFRRSWKEPVQERNHESETRDSLNQHRFLQCSLSRPWPVYGFDPAKPEAMRHFDASGLPIELGSMLSGLDDLPRPRGFAELPVLWLRRAGFSGVGVVVVDEAEKEAGIYYLQMGSTEPLLRDYYEMPYFWLGEQPGTPWPEVVQAQLAEGRPQHIQCLFRGHRQAIADPAIWEPELLRIFRDGSARWLAPFGRGRFLYCPDGEISFFLLCLRLLRLFRSVEGASTSMYEKSLLEEFQKIASSEIWSGEQDTRPELKRRFNELLNLPSGNEPIGLREELLNLGLITADKPIGEWAPRETNEPEGTPRLRSLVAWLMHFREACENHSRTDSFIPTDFLVSKPPEGIQGWFSLPAVVARIGSGVSRTSGSPALPRCIAAVVEQLGDIPSREDGPSFGLRAIIEAITSVVAENLGAGEDLLFSLENMIIQIVRRGRFPLAGYYAWRSSGTRDFCLGHFAVPIGQGNPVTSREEEGSVPWREDQFFLAGIDERLLCGVESDDFFRPDSDGARRLARSLENVALLGRVLFSPLADSTINYTIFQKRILKVRQSENAAALFRAHQMDSLLSPIMAAFDDASAYDSIEEMRALLDGFRESVYAVSRENGIYLDLSTGRIGPKEKGVDDYQTYNLIDFLRNVVRRYERWADDVGETDRQKPITVSVEDVTATAAFPSSYVGTILWELINNHQKHSPQDPTTAIAVRAQLTVETLTIIVEDHSAKVPAKVAKQGYEVGQASIRRILRFMMSYDMHRESPFEPRFAPDPSGAGYISMICLDLGRIRRHFDPDSELLVC
jgi:hypothetical protein